MGNLLPPPKLSLAQKDAEDPGGSHLRDDVGCGQGRWRLSADQNQVRLVDHHPRSRLCTYLSAGSYAVGLGQSCQTALSFPQLYPCLLYTSDAADDLLCVDLGGSR